MRNKLLLLLLVFFSFGTASAASRYVSDLLYVPLRAGPGANQKVLATLKSGDKLQLVREAGNGYVEVKTSKGLKGFFPSRYLVDKPIAATQLARAKAEAAKVKSGMKSQNVVFKELKSQMNKMQGSVAKLEKEKGSLEAELKKIKAISGNSIAISAERDKLKSRVRKLEEDNGGLLAKNQALLSDNQNEGIKLGVGAILFGMILGFVTPYLKPRRRSTNHLMRLR